MIKVLIPRFDPTHPKGCIQNMADLYNECAHEDFDLVAFIHSDVEIYDPDWQEKVEEWFRYNHRTGLVGFGGAWGLGSLDIYKTPYKLVQLARYGYASNQRDWKAHGEHLIEPMQCAMLDGFALIFRKSVYVEDIGGWHAAWRLGLQFHCYDNWACCMMARLGWEVWALPIDCLHRGGGVSVTTEYHNWLLSQGISGDSEVHEKAHRIIYDEFRDVLPIRVR